VNGPKGRDLVTWFDPILAQVRFGTGLRPSFAGPVSVDQMTAQLIGDDIIANALPIPVFDEASPSPQDFVAATRARRDVLGTDAEEAAQERVRELRRAGLAATYQNALTTIARGVQRDKALFEHVARCRDPSGDANLLAANA